MAEKKLGIKVISNSSGILPHTLRVWENRYQAFSPERSEGGQRLYSENDLRKANLLASLTRQGHAISKVAHLSIDELESLLVIAPFPKIKMKAEGKVVEQLLGYVKDYKVDYVLRELQMLRTGLSVKSFIFDVVLSVMREAGALVACGEYSITQEHIVSTIIRDQLGQIQIPRSEDSAQEMVFATPSGNFHELAVLIAEIIARANRKPTRFLGAGHPADSLGAALNVFESPYLVLGVISADRWDYNRDIVDYLVELDKSLKTKISVILGGGIDKDFPPFENIIQIIPLNSLEKFDEFIQH